MKPEVNILKKGYVGEVKGSLLGGNAHVTSTTVGLIKYSDLSTQEEKMIVVDTGMASDWDEIRENINKYGNLNDISYVVISHWDQDHIQNLKEFKGAVVISGAGTQIVGTNEFGQLSDLFPDNTIGNQYIKFDVLGKSHSRDEVTLLVDSSNRGRVLFIGDLILGPSEIVTPEMGIMMDTAFGIDPIKKYLFLRDIYRKYLDVDEIYCGHYGEPISIEGMKNIIESMEKSKYIEFFKELLVKGSKELANYISTIYELEKEGKK